MGQSEDSPEKEVHSNTGPPKKKETFQINNLTLYVQEMKQQQDNPEQVEGRK